MANDKLCIICDTRKPGSHFETKGEHVVPRFLGNRKLRTPHVCKACNGGLGGTVDLALKNVGGVTRACLDRGVGGAALAARGIVDVENFSIKDEDDPRDNLDVKGAILKIVYEAAHLRLGNDWLNDPVAIDIRKVLFAYVNKNKTAAHKLMDGIGVNYVPADIFYNAIGKSRGELLRRAVSVKTCLNGLWLIPLKAGLGANQLAMAFDIEGLPLGNVVVSRSMRDIAAPELIAPVLR